MSWPEAEKRAMKILSAFQIGGVFGLGILLAGMADPAKVLNFFDIAGTWDPSLVFVMGAGMLTAMAGYRFVLGRRAPLFEQSFDLPRTRVIDAPLLLGSAVFGIGWGIAGFCPGGAIPALGLGHAEPYIFVAAMLIGMFAARTARGMRTQAAAA